MILLIVFLVCLFTAIGAGLLAGWSDFKGMTIPNSHSLIVIIAFIGGYLVLWISGREDVFYPLSQHILSALIIFGVTAALFAFNVIGAADSKLAAAYAFWIGLSALPVYLFYMALAGGILGIAALALQKWRPFKAPPEKSWIAEAQAGESKVPYGIAIVAGALVSFAKIGYFDTEVMASFLFS